MIIPPLPPDAVIPVVVGALVILTGILLRLLLYYANKTSTHFLVYVFTLIGWLAPVVAIVIVLPLDLSSVGSLHNIFTKCINIHVTNGQGAQPKLISSPSTGLVSKAPTRVTVANR